jgi:hypothetical protein
MNKFLLTLISVFLVSTSFYKHEVKTTNTEKYVKTESTKLISKTEKKSSAILAEELYNSIGFENCNKLNSEVFYKAYLGFENLKKAGELPLDSHLLTVCDFSLSSLEKRLWVIDLNEHKILFNSLVAHGKNTGEEFAQKFSNT